MTEQFGLTINPFGLLNPVSDWTPILTRMNNREEGGFEPVLWYVAKVKRIAFE